MTTGEGLTGSERVQDLQHILHAKAKEEPERRFHALADKVWRMDVLEEAWKLVRRNGGSAGVDRERIQDIEARGVTTWLRELSQDLRDDTYVPQPVRQVLIPKKQPGKFRPLNIPTVRDRVAQTSAWLVLWPIFEADLQPEQYGYRPGRSAHDAVRRIHRLLNQGHREVVDLDLSNYFGEIPHAELMRCMARRISDGRMLRLLKAWLVMPVVVTDDQGRKRTTNPGRRTRKGTPQGSPISPLLSNIYMRRFILGWHLLGYARQFSAEIVCYADDLCVLGRMPAQTMLMVAERLFAKAKLKVNTEKTRCLRCPEEPLHFLGYRIGWNYRPKTGRRYIGTRPSKSSVQSICRRISAQTAARYGPWSSDWMIKRLNWMLSGWANYFILGQVRPAYNAVDMHTTKRLRQWFSRKHKVESGKHVRFSDDKLYDAYGLTRLGPTTTDLPWAKGMRPIESRMRENRTSGLTSRGRKRIQGSRTEARSESDGQATGP